MSDLSDILKSYMIRRPVEAVRLDDAVTLARVGRWITEQGGICSWVSAEGQGALQKAGESANRIWIYRDNGARSETIGLGDWVVHITGPDFLLVTDRQFNEVYQAVAGGELPE